MAAYYLMNADVKVLEFSHETTDIGNVYEILSIFDSSALPMDFPINANMQAILSDWVESRTIPVNRRHMKAVIYYCVAYWREKHTLPFGNEKQKAGFHMKAICKGTTD